MMTTDQSASERAYMRLKNEILSGKIATGPLDLRLLGDKLKMSVTPVREALARLSAERLVRLAPHQGYAVASLSGRRLENLYEFAGAIVDMAVVRCATGLRRQARSSSKRSEHRTYAEGMSCLVKEMATAQGNLELRDHLLALDDRLQPARRCEPRVFPDCEDELNALVSLWDDRRFEDLQRRFQSHFQRRMDRADALARLLSDPQDDV